MTNPATTSKPAVNQLLGINDQGEAVGIYNDAKGNAHAYEWDRVSSSSPRWTHRRDKRDSHGGK